MDIKFLQIKEKDILIELKEDLKKTFKTKTPGSNVKANRTSWYYYTEEKGKNLFDKIKPYFNNLNIIQCWGNHYVKGDSADKHIHKNNQSASGEFEVCGIIYLTDSKTGTFFDNLNIISEAKMGKVVLFKPETYHSVPKVEEERFTIAFNARYKL